MQVFLVVRASGVAQELAVGDVFAAVLKQEDAAFVRNYELLLSGLTLYVVGGS